MKPSELKRDLLLELSIAPAVVAGIGGVASGLGALFSSSSNVEAQIEANKANVGIARESMAFSERMANTAHQRQKADLLAAGLNPILAANQGASAPQGQTATMQAPKVQNVLGEAMTSGLSALQLGQQLESAQIQNAKTLADTAVSLEGAANVRSQTDLNTARAAVERVRGDQGQQDFMFSQESYKDRLKSIRSTAGIQALEERGKRGELPGRLNAGEVQRYTAPINEIVDTVTNALSPVSSGLQAADRFLDMTSDHRRLQRSGRDGVDTSSLKSKPKFYRGRR